MKRLVIAIVFICAAAGLAVGGYFHTRSLCEEAIEHFTAIADAAEKGDRERTLTLCRKTEELWEKQSVMLGIYLNHDVADEVRLNVKGLMRLAREGEFGELADDCYECVYYLKLIEETVRPTVENIL